jgi:hypothetical protein
MRDRETIDSELRRAALRRQSIREQGRQPSSRETDELLDELLAHAAGIPFTRATTSADIFVPEAWLRSTNGSTKTRTAPRRRQAALRRLGLSAALPLSLIAVIAAVVVMFAMRHQDSSQESAQAQPAEAAPTASPKQVAPKIPVPHINIIDSAFVETLKNEGVPVPSQDYVTSQGHAVCDFLARQPNFEDALKFVQGSSIWDANQSTDVIAGAIVSYCPQAEPAVSSGPASQNALSGVQAIEGKLHDVQGDLQGIQGVIDGLPGHP